MLRPPPTAVGSSAGPGRSGSPYRKANVKSTVAVAEAPAPIRSAPTSRWPQTREAARIARGSQGNVTNTRMTCSANTIVAAGSSLTSGSRKSASVPHSAAAMATSQVRSVVLDGSVAPARPPLMRQSLLAVNIAPTVSGTMVRCSAGSSRSTCSPQTRSRATRSRSWLIPRVCRPSRCRSSLGG